MNDTYSSKFKKAQKLNYIYLYKWIFLKEKNIKIQMEYKWREIKNKGNKDDIQKNILYNICILHMF